MELMNYGHGYVIYFIGLLLGLHIVLDLVPLAYHRVREAVISKPGKLGSGLIAMLILTACFLI